MDVRVGLIVLRLSGAEDKYHTDWLQYNVAKLKEGDFVVDDREGRPGVFVAEKIITDKKDFPEGFMESAVVVITLREILCTNTLQFGWVKGRDECERECAYRGKCPFRNLLMTKV